MNKIEYINNLSKCLDKLPANKKAKILDKYINLIDKNLNNNSTKKSITDFFVEPKKLSENIMFERNCDIAGEFPSFFNIIQVIKYSYCIKWNSVLLYFMLLLLLLLFIVFNAISILALLSSFYVFIITTIAMLNFNAVLIIFSYALCILLFCLCPLIGVGTRLLCKYILNFILIFAVSKINIYQS